MIIDSYIKKKKLGYLCRLEIIYGAKEMPIDGSISYKLEKYFETQLDALAFYCLKLTKENSFGGEDLELANRSSNIKLSKRQFIEYLEHSKKVFPELWI